MVLQLFLSWKTKKPKCSNEGFSRTLFFWFSKSEIVEVPLSTTQNPWSFFLSHLHLSTTVIITLPLYDSSKSNQSLFSYPTFQSCFLQFGTLCSSVAELPFSICKVAAGMSCGFFQKHTHRQSRNSIRKKLISTMRWLYPDTLKYVYT